MKELKIKINIRPLAVFTATEAPGIETIYSLGGEITLNNMTMLKQLVDEQIATMTPKPREPDYREPQRTCEVYETPEPRPAETDDYSSSISHKKRKF